MLPPFIIDQIRKREEDEKRKREQPVVELPLHRVPRSDSPRRRPLERKGDEEDADRGVIIIDLTGG